MAHGAQVCEMRLSQRSSSGRGHGDERERGQDAHRKGIPSALLAFPPGKAPLLSLRLIFVPKCGISSADATWGGGTVLQSICGFDLQQLPGTRVQCGDHAQCPETALDKTGQVAAGVRRGWALLLLPAGPARSVSILICSASIGVLIGLCF